MPDATPPAPKRAVIPIYCRLKILTQLARISHLTRPSKALLPSLLVAALCLPFSSHASDLVAATSGRQAVLGSAYNSKKEEFPGQSCVTGTPVPTGTAVATFSFDQSLTESQAAQQLGFGAGGRARFGVVEASASAQFMRNSVSSSYSVSAIWVSEYRLPTQKLDAPSPNEVGKALTGNDDRWIETCGDEYVGEITYGARLFFSIRVDFASTEEKQAFQAQFSLAGPLYSAQGNLEQASQRFSKNSRVIVSALQIGGDVSKITDLFSDTEAGRAGFVQCTLGSFTKCAEVVNSALKYATSTSSGFPSQLTPASKPGAAPLVYRSIAYKAAGIYPAKYPFLDEANEAARQRLHSFFEKQVAYSVLIDRIISAGFSGDRLSELLKQRRIVDGNVASILAASKICYETPLQCLDAVQRLTLAAVDDGLLVLPALPTADFRLLTPLEGVWSREESVKVMTADGLRLGSDLTKCVNAQAPEDRNALRKCVLIMQLGLMQGVVGVDESASVALRIAGQGLREAALFFENKLIKTIPLTRGLNSFPDKIGDDWAIVIVQTNRANPGWLDVDLVAERNALWIKEMPKADGVFYLNVTDAFGRVTRFDLEYQSWERAEIPGNGRPRVKERSIRRNRWWDAKSGGTKVTGPGPWTYDRTASVETSR
ncbi:MAG: hypothetical protein JNK48_24600 [Bryobacterales bacterium]|nr:hypothetical protein [Bryobacterales bacterium]